MNTAHREMSRPQPVSLRVRSRLTFNEQLSFFAAAEEVGPSQTFFGWWATLALVLAVVPWVVVGFMIWMFA